MWSFFWTSLVYVHDDVLLCVSSFSSKKDGFSIPRMVAVGFVGCYIWDVHFMSKKSHTKQNTNCRGVILDCV